MRCGAASCSPTSPGMFLLIIAAAPAAGQVREVAAATVEAQALRLPPRSERPVLIVLSSSPPPRLTTNPYIVMLNEAVAGEPDVEVVTYGWRFALLGRYDVFHVHWPEALVTGRGRLKRYARQALYLLLLLRLRLLRRPIVRTVHNLELPRGLTPVERALIRLTDRWTTLRIRVNESTVISPEQPSATVVHGHYRDWYARYPEPEPVPGRIVFFGQIRGYKGVPALVEAFRQIPPDGNGLTLRIAGAPSGDELAEAVRAAAGGDERVSLRFEFLSDADLVDEVGRAELVVLPYPEMHNSGGVLAALSLARPVLLPDNPVNRSLADEVGPGWLWRFDPPLTGADLLAAVEGWRASRPDGGPRLDRRDWAPAGRAHVVAYRQAIELVRGPRR